MKKMIAGLMTAALVLMLASTSALAAPRNAWAIERIGRGIQQAGQMCRRACYVDADNNGVCDNYDPAACPGNGQGNGQGNCQGGGYVDADNNGVCDNYDPAACPGNGQGSGSAGSGQGWSQGQGRGHHGGGHHR